MSLRELIEAVEAGNLPEPIFHGSSAVRGHWAYRTGLDADQRRYVFRAYNGSLDAAKALHDALLPGWRLRVQFGGVAAYAAVTKKDDKYEAVNPDPARAWLLAILRAMESRDVKGEG